MKYQQNNKIIQGASVTVRNGDVNGALKKLKKILDDDNRQKDLAKHEHYEKPSIKGKRARAAAKKRQQKQLMENIGTAMYRQPTGVRWMKSKRSRRKVLDDHNAFMNAQRAQNKG